MSIRKKLILSNIAMIAAPFALFLLVEMIAGYILLYTREGRLESADLEQLLPIRVTGLLLAITIANGAITYVVSKSILQQVRMLTQAAQEIARGNLDFSLSAKSHDEIGELASIFEQMRGKLLEAKELQSKYEENRKELIASISHDLRTPMTSIKGYARGILDGVARSPDKVEHYARTIYLNAGMMEKMINELFLYSRLELKKMPMQLEEVDLKRFLYDYMEELDDRLQQEGGRVVFTIDHDQPYVVMADRSQLRRVVENVVHNSLKYMDKPAKSIEIRLVSEAHRVKVEIEDNGIGIAPDALPYIFDSFYRADEARNSSTGGTGLGMAIAKQIIEAHNGEIGASSVVHRGTVVYFYLNKPPERLEERDA